jgi:hypothetical protein
MEFRLVYDGPLKTNRGAAEKQALRRYFHVQLKELVARPSMHPVRDLIESNHQLATFINLAGFRFAPIITERLQHVAKLHITFLTPDEPGRTITQGGDLDNRLKTLLDGLRAPRVADEVPAGETPQDGEDPFYCLLEDDSLITGLSVTTDRLLRPEADRSAVVLVIHVTPERTFTSIGTSTWNIA